MFRHGQVMLQIKNLLIAGAVEISFVTLRWQHVIKRGFKVAVILRPLLQTGYEKAAKTHFIDFDFLAKRNVRELILVFVNEALAKAKMHRAWKNDIKPCVYTVSRQACEVSHRTEFCESSSTH